MKLVKLLSVIVAVGLLLLVTGCERKVVNQAANNDNASLQGCFACHGETSFDGAILQAEGEWKNSVHASGNNVDYTNRAGQDCRGCHDQQGFIDLVTKGTLDSVYSTVSAIHCFTCHAPHTTGTLELRTKAPYTLKSGVVFDHGEANLCANCHHARTALASDFGTADTVLLTSRMGPHHGPQADLLQGSGAGFQHASYTYTSSTHATAVRDGCIGCHMGNPNQHDGYNIGGHSWNMAYTNPETNVEYTLVGVCQTCHTTFTSLDAQDGKDLNGDGITKGYQSEIDDLHDSLRVLLGNLIVKQSDGSYLVKNNVWVKRDVAGAVYNWVMVNEDRSHGIHNPKYIADILKNSIAWLNAHASSVGHAPLARLDQ